MKNNINQSRNYKLAVTGVLGALSVVLAVTPLGYIQLGGLINITIMHIPAILAALTAGLIPGIAVGTVFGLTSLIRSIMMGGAANPFFLNPLVAVLPRMLFPIAVWAINKGFSSIPHMPRTVSGAISAAFGTLAHTMLVMLSIYIFYGAKLMEGLASTFAKIGFDVSNIGPVGGYFAVIAAMEVTNGFWEIIGAVVIVAAVLGSMYAVSSHKSKLSKLEDDETETSAEVTAGETTGEN